MHNPIMMSSNDTARFSHVRLSGVGAFMAALLTLGVVIFAMLTGVSNGGVVGFLLFVGQMLWLPVPNAVAKWLHADTTVRGALLPMNAPTGMLGILLMMLGYVIGFPVNADVVAVANLQYFGFLLLGVWLVVVGMAMWPAHNKAWAVSVIVIGLLMVVLAMLGLFRIIAPDQRGLGLILPVACGVVGMGLIRAKGV